MPKPYNQSQAIAATAKWYLSPEALDVIAGIGAAPKLVGGTELLSGTVCYGYSGADVDRLARMYGAAFAAVNQIRPWPRDAISALLECSDQEVLAALYGDPDGLDWAHPERAARRTAIRADIDAALTQQVAA